MITEKIRNSSKKEIGIVIIDNNSIIINTYNKPLLTINDPKIYNIILNQQLTEENALFLYNQYELTIGELAALFRCGYSKMNGFLKKIPQWRPNNQGRRNAMYGKKHDIESKKKMSQKAQGRKIHIYERTPEIRKKISSSLKQYFKSHPQNPLPHQENWKNGKYDRVDFKRGIGGKLYSYKNKKTFHFRSLLELKFFLKLEEDVTIKEYQYESLHIPLPNGKSYTPDFFFNNTIIELKSKKFLQINPDIQKKVEYKKQYAEEYCKKNNFLYKIIYDIDLDFDTERMKHFLKNNPDIIKHYQISFNQPERIWSNK